MSPPSLIVIAKAPVAGRSKTRLSPPLTADEAAALAEAALVDTLHAVAATPAARRVVALDGAAGPWLAGPWPSGPLAVIAQRGAGLAARLASAFEDVGGPAFLVAMDTPQLTPELLAPALALLEEADGPDAVLGPASDGGYWGIGLRRPRREVFERVPMSNAVTAAAQRDRLAALGLTSVSLPALRDVDTIADARAVARAAPDTRFAAALRASGHAADDGQAVAEAAA